MNKKTVAKLNFTPLDETIARKQRSVRFRKAYSEEMSQLRLAHEIKTLRQKMKMTQIQVAAKAKMPQSVIARIESGTHSFSIATLHKIAQVFGKQVSLVK